MGYEEVSGVEKQEVVRRWQLGQGQRTIARGLGLSRGTVRRYIAVAREMGLERDGPAPSEEQLVLIYRAGRPGRPKAENPTDELLAPWAEQIHKWLTEDGMLMTRIQELLAERGCEVPYTSLRRFIERRGWSRNKRPVTVRMDETDPGKVAEYDFGKLGYLHDPETERRRTVWAALIVLRYSRHMHVWPMIDQDLDEVVEGLDTAWAFFDGVPQYLVLDNFPAAIARADDYYPRQTRGFLEYSKHRGFASDPARVGHPKDKPRVERGVPYVRERFFKGANFESLAHMRSEAERWCLEVAGLRVHGTTRKKPLIHFDSDERHMLMPWNGEPYEVPNYRTAKVHSDHHIQCLNALYSVPSDRCPPGQRVDVQLTSKVVRISFNGELIKTHPRQEPGGRSTDRNDYPKELRDYTLRSTEHLSRQVARFGPSVAEFAVRLFAGSQPWARIRQGYKLRRLCERYGSAPLEAACAKALSVDLINVHRLESIISQALEKENAEPDPKPMPPGRFTRPGSAFAIPKQEEQS